MKNLKKIIATILTTTLTMSCIGSMSTFGSEDWESPAAWNSFLISNGQ